MCRETLVKYDTRIFKRMYLSFYDTSVLVLILYSIWLGLEH